MTNTKEDNYVTNCTDVPYTKNKTKLPWSIKSGQVYDKNQAR